MEYKGKLYGKVGKHYFPLVMDSDDVDKLKTELSLLKSQLPLPSVSREKADLKGLIEFAKERLNPDKALDYNNDDKVVYAYNSKQITIGDLKKLLEFATHEPEAPAPSDEKIEAWAEKSDSFLLDHELTENELLHYKMGKADGAKALRDNKIRKTIS